MPLSQIPKVAATFDDPNLISAAGLVPVMRLARRAGLPHLVTALVEVPGGAGADAAAKVASIVAGMLAGADNIDDLAVLREGGSGQGGARGESAIDSGHVPAGVHLWSCAAVGRGGRRVAGEAGRASGVAARCGSR